VKETICFRQVRCCLLLAALFLLATVPQPVHAQDEFIVARDSVVIRTAWGTKGKVNRVYVWLPQIEFIVYGPPNQGSVFWMEAGFPGKKEWLKEECDGKTRIGEFSDKYRDAGRATEIRCNLEINYYAETKATTYTGMVDFSLHMRNELQGISDATLFAGKFKVVKEKSSHHSDGVDFYVDEDWRIPIGFLTAAEAGGLRAELSFRKSVGNPVAYLFYQGKQLEEHRCDGSSVGLSQDGKVYVVKCDFWEVSKVKNPYRPTEQKHVLSENPGEYEIKVLSDGRLVRSVKFSVDAEGSFDDGIATANKLGTKGVIVPVKVIGEQDGMWNRLAWKTEAFYGNPLTGFMAAP